MVMKLFQLEIYPKTCIFIKNIGSFDTCKEVQFNCGVGL